MIYKEMYKLLFKVVTMAIRRLEKYPDQSEEVAEALKLAQAECEEMYMDCEDDQLPEDEREIDYVDKKMFNIFKEYPQLSKKERNNIREIFKKDKTE